MPAVNLYRIKDVCKSVGLCKATIYNLISKQCFPRPVQLSARAVAWRSCDIEQWISERPLTETLNK